MRRLVLVLGPLALAAGLLPGSPVTQGAAADPVAVAVRPTGPCDDRSWTAGTVELCRGELVYRDYVVDDFGADDGSRPTQPSSLSTAAGDQRYPAGLEQSADLVTLRLAVDGARLRVTALLAALQRTDSTLVAVAIDSDDDPATGGGRWVSGTRDLGVTSRGWDRLLVLDRGDVATNTMSATFPLPPGDRWRVQAITAQADGTVMNLAFRGTGEKTVTGAWWEDEQAATLRAGDVSASGATVAVADLRSGVTRRAPVPTGFQQRVYTSDHVLPPGEGFSYAGVPGRHPGSSLPGSDVADPFRQDFQLLGRHQPYGLYVPEQVGPYGVQLALHGLNANHSSLVDAPGFQQRFGEELNRLVVVPEGRGKAGYYSDVSERDVLDVLADLERVFPVDRSQVFSGGYSMGGYGAMRMATLYPDRFAGMAQWVGFTGDCSNNTVTPGTGACRSGAVGNVIDFVGNLRHVPSALLYSGADYLVHANTAAAVEQRFAGASGPYAFWFHPAAEHLTYVLTDDWRKEAAYTKGLRLVRDPARVTYRTDLSLGNATYGIRHDRAYWLSGIRAARAGAVDVDATTNGCGRRIPFSTVTHGQGVDPVPWQLNGRQTTSTRALVAADRVTVVATNLSSVVVDTERACLSSRPLAYRITTDGPATVRFSDGRVVRVPGGRVEGLLPAAR